MPKCATMILLLFLTLVMAKPPIMNISELWADEHLPDSLEVNQRLEKVKALFARLADEPIESIELVKERPGVRGDRGRGSCVINKDYRFDFNVATGEVYRYDKRSKFNEEGVRTARRRDAISSEKAFSTLSEILPDLGLGGEFADFTIEFVDITYSGDPNSLFGCMWLFSKELEYNGIPCRFCGFTASVSPYSGAVVSFEYRPVIVPTSVTENISAEDAIRIVTDFISGSSPPTSRYGEYVVDKESGRSVDKVIAVPNCSSVTSEFQDPFYVGSNASSRYCWEVSVKVRSPDQKTNDIEGALWVDIENGQVIGGLPAPSLTSGISKEDKDE